ncbi:nuclear pore protein 84/107 [Dipodascopsis tothii]|uniref:nuclear pore protein 84/107 n=1 Tax=Dipodascopsis tothii TaxID=44089 RepID=UPI0034CFE566
MTVEIIKSAPPEPARPAPRMLSSFAKAIDKTDGVDTGIVEEFAERIARSASCAEPYDLLYQYSDVAAAHARACRERADPPAEVENWDLEARTWTLIALVYEMRQRGPQFKLPSLSMVTSNSVFEQWYLDYDDRARETLLVRSWLQQCLAATYTFGDDLRGSKWQTTKARVKSNQVRATAFGRPANPNVPGRASDVLVTELDVDAPMRQGKAIDAADAEDDRRVFANVFRLIQTGQLDRARTICEHTGNFTLNAAVNGAVEYCDPAVDATGPAGERAFGTKRKALWRRMCAQLARAAEVPDKYERAIYGFICGDLDTVVAVCDSWESELLAHVQHLLSVETEQFIDTRRREAPGHGLVALQKAELRGFPRSVNAHADGTGVSEILDLVSAHWANDARHPLRIIQVAVLRGEMGQVVASAADKIDQIRQGSSDRALNVILEEQYFLRVITHLVLFLRQAAAAAGSDDDSFAGTDDQVISVLTGYIEMLTIWGKGALVPVYVSQLPPPEAVEAYSFLLADLRTPAARREQFELADRYGLDMASTLRRTIQRAFEAHRAAWPPADPVAPATALLDADAAADLADLDLVAALKWFIEAGMWADAVCSANAMYVRFFGAGHLASAFALQALLDPTAVHAYNPVDDDELDMDGDEVLGEIGEFRQYGAMLAAATVLRQWHAIAAERSLSHAGQHAWKMRARDAVDDVKAVLTDVIESWMRDRERDAPGLRRHELHQLRVDLVPELIIQLHDVLIMAGTTIDKIYFTEALNLLNSVAWTEDSPTPVTELAGLMVESGKLAEYVAHVSASIAQHYTDIIS